MHSTPLIPSSRSGSPLANARIPSGTDAQITALDPLLDRICPILESLPRVSRRSLPPRGAASVIASYLPEQSAQVPPIFNGLRYAHPGLHPRPSSPTSGVVKRAFIFACVRVSPRHSSASRVKPTCRLSLLPETSFTLSPKPNGLRPNTIHHKSRAKMISALGCLYSLQLGTGSQQPDRLIPLAKGLHHPQGIDGLKRELLASD